MRQFLFTCFAFCASCALAQSDVTINNIVYRYYDTGEQTGTAEVVDGKNCSANANVVIEASITSNGKEYPVTTIGNSAFYGAQCTSIVIPNSVTTIGKRAFEFCWCTSITIPNSVISIGNEAFSDCNVISSITIPKSVTTIGDKALDCPNLNEIIVDENNAHFCSQNGVLFNKSKTRLIQAVATISGSYTIPNTVVTIGNDAFSDCKGLTGITIPNSVTSIEDYAFYRCSNLESLTIPNSVTTIGSHAFWLCDGLTGSLTIPNSVTYIGEAAFQHCDALTSLTIGNSVATIERGAFYGCSLTGTLTIPASVTKIGSNAFTGHSGLEFVVDEANPYFSFQDRVLFNKSKTELIDAIFPINGSYTIPASVTSIACNAFEGCSLLTDVSIPNSVTTIGDEAFRGCI